MKVFRKIGEWQQWRKTLGEKSLGFVPTMGALHEGHSSLVRKSWDENDCTLVSIFVNPTQFDDPDDFNKYPQSLDKDLARLEKDGADFVLLPDYKEIYSDLYRYQVSEGKLSKILCGIHRPGHFQGVLTVVLKLLNIARADRAYFGEKDFQQFQLIKGMAEAFFVPTEIIPCPTVRETSGLALSSRNQRLSDKDRGRAVLFAKALSSQRSDEEVIAELVEEGFEVDYIETIEGRRYGAVKLGGVRLIDNVER